MSNDISNARLPEYKLLRFSSIGAIATPEEVQVMAKELLALRNARKGWKLVPLEPSPGQRLASKRYKASTKITTGPGFYRTMVAAAPEVQIEN